MSELETQLEECGVCHALHPLEELRSFDDTLICPDCLEDSTVVCGRCGERMWRDDDTGNEDSGHLCQSCYDRYYGTCERCGRILPEEDLYMEENDEMLCYDCHRRQRSRYSINDYSYKPDPIFYGSDTLYMGVEIELDEGGESDKANGVYRGRPPMVCPDFDRVVTLWQSREITAQEAARRLGISPSTFYRKLKGGKNSHE